MIGLLLLAALVAAACLRDRPRAAAAVTASVAVLAFLWPAPTELGPTAVVSPLEVGVVGGAHTRTNDIAAGGATNELYRFLPPEWNRNVHIDDMCQQSSVSTASPPPSPTEWQQGAWYVVWGEGSHGGQVTGYTPSGLLRDDLPLTGDWGSDQCAWEQRYFAGPGGGGSLGPRLTLGSGNGPYAAATMLKTYFVWVTYLEEAGVAGGVNDWVYRQAGTKFARPTCTSGSSDPCPGPDNGWGILDFLDGSMPMLQFGTDENGCAHLPANIWARWPSHQGDTIGPASSGACRFRADEQLEIGVPEIFWICVDADPDHNLNPVGDGHIVSWGFGEAEGMMGWHYVNNGSVDVVGIWRYFLDSTWGGDGTKPYDFSRWTLHAEVWTGDGTGTSQSCVDPPPAP